MRRNPIDLAPMFGYNYLAEGLYPQSNICYHLPPLIGPVQPLSKVYLPVSGFCFGGTMKEIHLTQGYVALVDDADYEWLMQWKWSFAIGSHNSYGYAVRHNPERPHRLLYMHRVIMKPDDHLEIDHADHDGLNNQRTNLRACSRGQNASNVAVKKANRTGYRGVDIKKLRKKRPYSARIKTQGRLLHIGQYASALEAAIAYDKAAVQYFGEFAILNFPTGEK